MRIEKNFERASVNQNAKAFIDYSKDANMNLDISFSKKEFKKLVTIDKVVVREKVLGDNREVYRYAQAKKAHFKE